MVHHLENEYKIAASVQFTEKCIQQINDFINKMSN